MAMQQTAIQTVGTRLKHVSPVLRRVARQMGPPQVVESLSQLIDDPVLTCHHPSSSRRAEFSARSRSERAAAGRRRIRVFDRNIFERNGRASVVPQSRSAPILRARDQQVRQ